MNGVTGAPVVRFHRWNPSLIVGAVFSFFALLQLGGAIADSNSAGAEIFGIVTGLLTGALAVRGFRSSTLIVHDGRLIVRTLLRRRIWPLATIRRASIETGVIGVAGYLRRYPVIHFEDGRQYECREINTSTTGSGELAPIVDAINEAVRRTSPTM